MILTIIGVIFLLIGILKSVVEGYAYLSLILSGTAFVIIDYKLKKIMKELKK